MSKLGHLETDFKDDDLPALRKYIFNKYNGLQNDTNEKETKDKSFSSKKSEK